MPGGGPGRHDRYAKTEISHPTSDPTSDNEIPVDRALAPGDIVAGKYQIERILGEGGMGMVFAATHLQLREPVALKFMNAAAVANPEASARFVREARAAARLRGEHVCRVLDLGETDEGDRYIVIEYLDGSDLSEVLGARGTLTVAEAVDYILQACEAMAEAHGAGIIHRDLKPANLFLTTGTDGAPCIKVVDFGISKLVNPETNAQVVTTTRSLMGSPLYMAPEQLVSAKDVDQRADIWALGTVLFQLISGRTPFQAESLPEVVAQVLHNEPPKLSTLAPRDVPAATKKLDAVIARCLAKSKDDRYGSVAELAADLAEVVPEASHLAMRSAAVLGASRHSMALPVATTSSKKKWVVPLILASVLAIAVIVTAVFVIGGGGDKSESEASKPTPSQPQATPAASKTTPSQEAPGDTKSAPTKPIVGDGSDIGSATDEKSKPDTAAPAPKATRGGKSGRTKSSKATKSSEGSRGIASSKSSKAQKDKQPKTDTGTAKKGSDLLAPDLNAPTKKSDKGKGKPKSDVLAPEI